MLNKASYMDEFLCEYIDGTMDYSVRAAFEECVECDTRLARQVKHLRGTQRLLCEYRSRTPKDLRARVRERLSCCLPFASPVRPPHTSILVGTATALALAAALGAGVSQYTPASFSGVRSTTAPIPLIHTKDPPALKKVEGSSYASLSPVSGS